MTMKTESKKIHTCHFEGCQASFSRPYKLEFHIKKHNGEKFICNVEGCFKSYTSPSHLKRHRSTAHENAGENIEILCRICGLTCNNKYNFKKHLGKHNESEFHFKCSQCFIGFRKKRQLFEHMCIHSGEYPYRCETCNIGFNKIHLLNKHKRNHKTYTCDCGEIFPRWTIFCAHRKNSCRVKAVDHKCIICNKIFTTRSNLRMHSLIHVDESQTQYFKCPYKNCTRSYKYKKNVNEHIKAFHKKSSQKLELNCTELGCQTVLTTYANLKRHLIKIHKSKFKKNKVRKARFDEGKPKKSAAALLSGIKLAKDEHTTVIKSAMKIEEKHASDNSKNVDENSNRGTNTLEMESSIENDSSCIKESDISNRGDLSSLLIYKTDNYLEQVENNHFTSKNTTNSFLPPNSTFNRAEHFQNTSSCLNLETSVRNCELEISGNIEPTYKETNTLLNYCNIKVNGKSAEIIANETDFSFTLRQCNETLQKLQHCAS